MTPSELTAARLAANLSKYALARRAGLQRSHLSEMEAGRRPITPRTVARIAAALASKEQAP
jgi:transcriptional regulator with XRE-family HTH domain